MQRNCLKLSNSRIRVFLSCPLIYYPCILQYLLIKSRNLFLSVCLFVCLSIGWFFRERLVHIYYLRGRQNLIKVGRDKGIEYLPQTQTPNPIPLHSYGVNL